MAALETIASVALNLVPPTVDARAQQEHVALRLVQ